MREREEYWEYDDDPDDWYHEDWIQSWARSDKDPFCGDLVIIAFGVPLSLLGAWEVGKWAWGFLRYVVP